MRVCRNAGRLVFLGLQIVAAVAYGAPGGPDLTFNGTGKQLFVEMTNTRDFGQAVAVQSDGKIVVAGIRYDGTETDIQVARYDNDGSLDTSFSGDGIMIYDGGYDDGARAVVIQPDGKILVGGYSSNGANDDVVIFRLTAAGALDPSFGTNGVVTYSGWLSSEQCNGMAVQADGKIVVAGEVADFFSNSDALLARFNADGTLDETFGFSGVTAYDSFSNESAAAVALQSDGKIVIAGYFVDGGAYDALVARFTGDGSLEFSRRYDAGLLKNERATGIAITNAGDIVVGGSVESSGVFDALLLKYDADGVADGSFGAGGTVIYDSGLSENVSGLVQQGDGKIILAASAPVDGIRLADFVLMRFDETGTIDASFAGSGRQLIDHGANEYAYGLCLQPDGRILAVGSTGTDASTDQFIVRLGSGGALDGTFAAGGLASLDDEISIDSYSRASALQSDGKLVVVGQSIGKVLVVRYLSDGTLDPDFGAEGKVTFDRNGEEGAYGVALQADGKILVSGAGFIDAAGDFLLLRLNTDGSLDTAFGSAGIVSMALSDQNVWNAVAVQPDGKIVVAGTSSNWMGAQVVLMRYHPDGTADTAFGTDGVATYDGGGGDNTAYALLILDDGQMVVAGSSSGKILLLQFLPDGTLDPSFGTGGVVAPDRLRWEYGSSVVRQPDDGKLVFAGYSYNNDLADDDLIVMRFDAAGELDPSFGSEGVFTRSGDGSYYPATIALQADGKLVVNGTREAAEEEIFVLRLTTDGSADTSFGTSGLVTYGDGSADRGSSLLIQPDGKIVITGDTVRADTDILIMRLMSGPYPVTAAVVGTGAVTSDDGLIQCGSDCTETYGFIGPITLTATGSNGYSFASWSGCDSTSGDQCTITTSSAKNLIATFADTTSPDLTVTSPADGLFTKNGTMTVNGTVTDNAAIHSLTVNGANVAIGGDGSFSHNLTLLPGSNTITVQSEDTSGHGMGTTRTVIYDAEAPVLAITTPAAGTVVETPTFTVAGTVSDANGLPSVTISVAGQTFTAAVNEGAFSQEVTLAVEQEYVVTVTATDMAGNGTTLTRNISFNRIGDVDGVPGLGLTDAVLALRYSIGLASPGSAEVARCDVAPLVNGVSQPDGVVDIEDVMLILRKVVGLNW